MKMILKSFVLCLLLIFSFSNMYSATTEQDFYPGLITVCFSADLVGNTRGDFNITIENGIIQTPFDWLNQLAEEYQIVNLTQKYRVKNYNWHKDGQYPSNVYRLETAQHSRTNGLLQALQTRNTDVLFAELEGVNRTTHHPLPPTPYSLSPTSYTPDDPEISKQWALAKVQAFDAWSLQKGEADIVVGIIDTGTKWNHEDIADNTWINEAELPGITIDWDTGLITGGDGIDNDGNGFIDDVLGWDFSPPTHGGAPPNNPFQSLNGHWHGTHVAGISAAVGDNGKGVAGLAYNAKLFSTKHGPYNQFSTSINNGYAGVYYMVDLGIRVINCSWGGGGSAGEANLDGNYAKEHGTLFVAAAGNDNSSSMFYPAAGEGIFSVASTTQNDGKSYFSNYGTWIDIAAPGSDILSTFYTNTGEDTYDVASGTSMAAPMVAGLAALLLSHNPNMTVDELETAIKEGADNIDDLNPNHPMGAGRINAYNSLLLVKPLDYDLDAMSLSGLVGIPLNTPATFFVTIQNKGQITASGYNISLMQVGLDNPLATISGSSIPQSETRTLEIIWTPLALGEYQIYAQIEWTLDERESNNKSNIHSLRVIPEGTAEAYAGNINSTATMNSAFVNYGVHDSITQTIYLENELTRGYIYHLTVRFTGNHTLVFPGDNIKIFLATTQKSAFDSLDDWIPLSHFTEVFSGELDVFDEGTYETIINFQNNFYYDGQNLVVMAVKDASVRYGTRNTFQFTNMPEQNRTISWNTNILGSPILDPLPTALRLHEGITNARFGFITTLSDDDKPLPILTTELLGNYPNPFNPETTIQFNTKNAGFVSIDIYNLRGQKVRSLLNAYLENGNHTVIWNGKDDNNSDVSSGLYFYQMRTGDFSQVKRMVLLK